MANVFICGAETLSLPSPGANATDPNLLRWLAAEAFLRHELLALFSVKYMTALACDDASALANFLVGGWGNVIPVSPNAIQQPNVVPTSIPISEAVSTFGANMVINLNGGISPDAAQQAAILALQAEALFTASASGTVLTVSAVTSGTIIPGRRLAALPGVLAGGTVILDQSSGITGGIGTYDLNAAQGSWNAGVYTPVASQTIITIRQDIFWRDAATIA
jgi:hypothetical protein